MVAKVSPNCTSMVASKVVSSMVNFFAKPLAIAVIDAVSSHEFIVSVSFIVDCSILYAKTELGVIRNAFL